MHYFIFITIFLKFNWVAVCYSEVSNEDYALMPELFYLENFDQCLLLEENFVYCTFTYNLMPLNETNPLWKIIQVVNSNPQNYRHDNIRHGICIPKTCPQAAKQQALLEIKSGIEFCYDTKYKHLGFKGNITSLTCQRKQSMYRIDIYDIIVGSTIILYIALIICASFYEGIARYRTTEAYIEITGTKYGKIISAFSVVKNWQRLTSKNLNPEVRKLRCIQGIRFYNMMCVIMVHSIMQALAGPVSNPRFVENIGKNFLNAFLTNGWFAVQSFFVISGWLLSYHFFETMNLQKEFQYRYIGLAIINRYMRLTPSLAFMIAFNATWLVRLSEGPNWDLFIFEEYRNCRKNWWTNLLYINNYVDPNHMCMPQTWYLASDTQLFILSIVILMLLWKNPMNAKIILGIVTTIGVAIPGVIAYIKNTDIVIRQYPESMYNMNNLRYELWHELYSSSYSNVGGYMIGLIFGSIFFRYRKTTLDVHRVHVVLWWFMSFGLCLFIIFVGAKMYDPLYAFTRLESALYWSFGKNIFALGVAIGIFGFTQKIGWFARWFLEWDCHRVLGRLTYSTYIIHATFIRIKGGYRRYPVSANDNSLFLEVLGDIALAYLAGMILCLAVEMPMSALQKLMIPHVHSKDPKILDCNALTSNKNYPKTEDHDVRCIRV